MGYFSDYKKGKLASLDQEKLQRELEEEKRIEAENDRLFEEKMKKLIKQYEADPKSVGKRSVMETLFEGALMIFGIFFWLAVIGFLFRSCAG